MKSFKKYASTSQSYFRCDSAHVFVRSIEIVLLLTILEMLRHDFIFNINLLCNIAINDFTASCAFKDSK